MSFTCKGGIVHDPASAMIPVIRIRIVPGVLARPASKPAMGVDLDVQNDMSDRAGSEGLAPKLRRFAVCPGRQR